jgi:hypothetical protein
MLLNIIYMYLSIYLYVYFQMHGRGVHEDAKSMESSIMVLRKIGIYINTTPDFKELIPLLKSSYPNSPVLKRF